MIKSHEAPHHDTKKARLLPGKGMMSQLSRYLLCAGRLTNRERKQTMTEELLADPDMQQSRKRRFTALQEEKSRWSHKKHKGSGERIKKRSKPKKH